MRITFLAIILVAVSYWANAQDIVTDRPDATESSISVRPGWVQLEAGFGINQINYEDSDSRSTLWAVPNFLARIGIVDQLELRIGTALAIDKTSGIPGEEDSSQTGLDNLTIGAKYAFIKDESAPLQAAVIVETRPTWPDLDLTGGGFNFGFIGLVSYDFENGMGLGLNTGYKRDGVADTNNLWYTLALAVPVSGPVGAFIEIFGEENFNDFGFNPYLDGGFTYLVNPTCQLDLSGGVSLSNPEGVSSDFFVALGISKRFDGKNP